MKTLANAIRGIILTGALAYGAPALAADSEAYVQSGEGIFSTTARATMPFEEDGNFLSVEYRVMNDKSECRLAFKTETMKAEDSLYMILTDRNCDGTVDRIKTNAAAPGEVELKRDKDHEELFRLADARYMGVIKQHKLQEQIDNHFKQIESNLYRLLVR